VQECCFAAVHMVQKKISAVKQAGCMSHLACFFCCPHECILVPSKVSALSSFQLLHQAEFHVFIWWLHSMSLPQTYTSCTTVSCVAMRCADQSGTHTVMMQARSYITTSFKQSTILKRLSIKPFCHASLFLIHSNH
jgi:hypothetical protein